MVRTIFLMLVTLGYFTLSCFGQSVGGASDEHATPSKGLRVFYVSHSLMWYVPELLEQMTDARGIADHHLVGLQSLGASRTLQHWNLSDDENVAKKALENGEVDVLVMSPISFPDEGVENYIKLGLKHNHRMKFIVQLSWGGGDIDNQNFPNGAFDNVDKEKTTEQLKSLNELNIEAGEAQAADLNLKYGNGKTILALVPSVQAMISLRSQIADNKWPGLTKQSELFVDFVHPSPPMETLNAYLHFAVLYGENPIGLPIPEGLKNSKQEMWNDDFNLRLQELAWDTVTNYPQSLVVSEKNDTSKYSQE